MQPSFDPEVVRSVEAKLKHLQMDDESSSVTVDAT